MPRTEVFNREHVLNQAKEVFWQKGYNGTSMQDLVDATGLNRSSLYNSFGCKKELYEETLKRYEKETASIFQKVLLHANGPKEALKKIFEVFLPEILGDTKGKGCYLMNCKTELGNQDSDLREWLLKGQEQSLQLFKDLIEEGQRLGEINSEDTPENYAHYLLSAFQGYRMMGVLLKDKNKLSAIIDTVFKALD